jgi:hypothetical protein
MHSQALTRVPMSSRNSKNESHYGAWCDFIFLTTQKLRAYIFMPLPVITNHMGQIVLNDVVEIANAAEHGTNDT